MIGQRRRQRGRRARLARPVGWLLAGLATTVAAMAAGPPRRGDEAALALRPKQSGQLAGIEIVITSPAASAPRRLVVSDLVVRLQAADGGGLARALGQPDIAPGARGPVLLYAEILVVAGGRLVIEPRARCGPWVGGASLCRTECDGGSFALIRQRGPRGAGLSLRLGRTDAAEEGVVRLGACEDAAGGDYGLAPRLGLGTAEVELAR